MKVLVTGVGGQLGSTIADLLLAEHEVVPLDHAALDLTDQAAVHDAVEGVHPDVVINCAAYNDVDGGEDHPDAAFAVNAFAVRSLAHAAHHVGQLLS